MARPSFGLEDGKPIWCSQCPQKDKDARDVKNKKCICGKSQPHFGLEDGKPIWCAQCPQKDKNARDVVHKKCVCGMARPTLGLEDGKPIWCAQCPQKDSNARNVVNKKCICGRVEPSFGLEDGKPIWCAQCPQKDTNARNVVSKKCLCGKARPHFGLEDGKPIWCAQCPQKDKNARDVVHKKCVCGKAVPSFGFEDGKPIWCAQCPQKDNNARNVVARKCASSWCHVQSSNPQYEGYCLHCFAHLFPDKPVSKNYKTKERLVIESLKELLATKYSHLQVGARYDKTVDGGCSMRRPDAFIDAYTHVLMGEIDEEGHSTEEYCSCENKRMMQLMKDVGMRPIVIVRLNPDSYTDHNGVRVKSCFKKGKDGNLIIADKKRWQERLNVFLDRISYHLDNIPEREVTVEHLYYDGFF